MQSEEFLKVGVALTREQGCAADLLAGTDLALVFREGVDCGFATVDSAGLHAGGIAAGARMPKFGDLPATDSAGKAEPFGLEPVVDRGSEGGS